MFKLESYIAPIILSYVDKYIKNFRPQDSQLSLWGGDASFHNLDLRLEVLEQELQLPFSFVSGHIHELLLHVPWTKLASEPITITINTIECILKLKGAESAGTADTSNQPKDKQKRSVNRRQEIETPPGYVQSLINKIVSNIKIYCNNLILKYVEEDIVVSMNVKLLTFESANEKWEPAYMDTSSSQVTLRKLITVSDLTVCVDKRNAAGKIDIYQEPVLYRCSLMMRMLRQYYSVSAKRASTTRLDIYCNSMEFGMTEQQVPMLLRVGVLLLALQQKQLKSETEIGTSSMSTDIGEMPDTSESWAGWAWSLVPSILPTSWDETYQEQIAAFGHILHIGFYIDYASLTFKVSETSNERSNYYTQRKLKYLPLLTLRLQGLFMESISNGNTWFQCSSGISQIVLLPVGQCSCAHLEVSETDGIIPKEYLKLGLTSMTHKSNSLFDSEALENKGQNRTYNKLWDFHVLTVTEETLLERTPAFATDFVYQLELPDDVSSDKLSELGSDLEYSNLFERSLLRTVIGAGRLRLCSGFFHRLSSLIMAGSAYDYSPYNIPKPDPLLSELPPPCAEDFDALSSNIPSRGMQITILSPVIELQMMDHPYFEPTKRNLYRKQKKLSTTSPLPNNFRIELPRITLECQCIDAKFHYPMYVKRLIQTVCQLPDPPKPMFDACHVTRTIKIMGISSHLIVSSKRHTTILMPSNLSFTYNTIIKPSYWINPDIPHNEITLESENITITGTKAKLMLIYHIIDRLNSGNGSNTINSLLSNSLLKDASRSFGMPYLELYIEGIRCKKVTTNSTTTIDASLGALKAFIYEPIMEIGSFERNTVSTVSCSSASRRLFSARDIQQILFISGPEFKTDEVNKENLQNRKSLDNALLTIMVQFSLNADDQPHPPILTFNIQETRICIDPLLCRWLLYEPRLALKKPENFDPHQRKNRNVSEAIGNILETPRRAGTPLESIHSSSDREHVNILPQRCIKEAEVLDFHEKVYNFLKKWFHVWKTMVLNGEISQCTVYFPVESLSAVGSQGIQEAVNEALRKGNPPEIFIMTLPTVTIYSASQRQGLSKYMTHLPIKLPKSVWTNNKFGFPWIVSISDMNCYTLQNGRKLNFLEPLFLNATIGVSTKSGNSEVKHTKSDITEYSEKISNTKSLKQNKNSDSVNVKNITSLCFASKADFGPLAICVHIDMSSVTLSISEVQVCLIGSILFGLTDVISTFLPEPLKEVPKSPDVMQNVLGWSSTISPTLIKDSTIDSVSEHTPPATTVISDLDNQNVKLTAWIQWTIARFRIKLLSHDSKEVFSENYLYEPKLKLVFDAEDIVSSVDFQSVYLKIKSKIGNATIQHFKKEKKNDKWSPGNFLGLVMRSKDDPSSIKRQEDIGFATVTITRASCRHTHALWGAAPKTKLKETKVTHTNNMMDFQTPTRYITEIVLTSQPIDFIVSLNILQSFFMILKPLLEMTTSSSESKGDNWLLQISNEDLPLVYVECQGIRLIVPSVELVGTGAEHDVCIFQIDAINLMPSAVNPICRNPCRPDIYQLAAQSRILNIPGSEVEDRQYQLDITGASINTGTWEEVDSILNSQGSSLSTLRTMNENPALEWNNLEKGQLSVTPHLNMCPVINRFDFYIIVAPAMIYKTNTLVCGHSMEVNCVSDVDLNISLSQIQLASVLLTEFLQIFTPVVSQSELIMHPKIKLPYPKFDSSHLEMEEEEEIDLGLDSGIETSELQSSFSTKTKESTVDITKPSHRTFESDKSFGPFPRPPSTLPSAHQNIPIDLLFTGGKILLILYQVDQFHGRSKMKQRDKKHKPILKDTNNEEGYEGSEEGSIEEKNIYSWAVKQFQPLFFISISQPNVFLSRFYLGRKVQLTCFDVRMKISGPEYVPLKVVPIEEDFPINLLETKTGMPNTSTGILPAFFTLKWTKGIGKPATVDIELARPTKILCSITRWNHLIFIKDKIKDSFKSLFENLNADRTSNKTSTSFISSVDVSKSTIDTYTKFKLIKNKLYGVTSLNITLAQLLLVVQTDNNPEVNLSFSKLRNNLTLSNRPEKLNNIITLDSITVGVSKDEITRLLLNPWTVSVETSLFWESWQSLDSNPQFQVSLISDCIMIDISPDQIKCLEMVIKDLNDFFSNLSYENSPDKSSNQYLSRKSRAPSLDKEQYYKDDLRAGAFQFIDASTDNVDELPFPYQVMFWNKKIAAMAWRYPQPRTLTKIRVFPVPFKLNTNNLEDDDYQILCHLEYWSECHKCYQSFIQFQLSENEVRHLQLPENSVQAVASVWRVTLSSQNENSQELDFDNSKVSISPRALAACMRVDSYFNKTLIPDLSLSMNLSTINISLYNDFNKSTTILLPPCLKQYTCDLLLPENHCFLTLTLNNTKIYLSTWNFEAVSFDVTTTIKCSVLDYAFLTQQTLLEPFSLKTEINLTKNMSVSILSKPLYFKFGPSIAHTLTVSMQMWEQYWKSKTNPKESIDLIIMTRYVICNDTNINLRFGQMTTDEDILLLPRYCHLYSWRSQKSAPIIRVGLEENSWIWSQPFQIDVEGTEACLISKEKQISLIVNVKSLSATQKQITFSGQLIICNILLEHLELKVVPIVKEDKDKEFKRASSHIVTGKSTPPSLVINTNKEYHLRLRFFGIESAWSGDIPLIENTKCAQPWLVKVPLQERGQFLSIWCRIIVQNFSHCSQILAVLWPLFLVHSNLPIDAKVHIATPSLNIDHECTISGKGAFQQLYCPGSTMDTSHQLIFQLDYGLPTSNPYVPLNYSLIDQRQFFKRSEIESVNETLEVLHNFDQSSWPYFEDLEGIEWIVEEQPLTHVQVRYQNACRYSSTLLVKLLPWSLLINIVGCPIAIIINEKELCRLSHHGIATPPKLEETFHIAVKINGIWNISLPLQLAKSEWSQTFYMPKITGSIPLEGNIKTAILCNKHICMLSITSSFVNEIRLLKVSSSHVLTNHMSMQMHVMCFAVPEIDSVYSIPKNVDKFSFTVAPLLDKTNTGVSIIQWYIMGNDIDVNASFALYVSISFDTKFGWSCPVRVDKGPVRRSVAVQSESHSIPVVIVVQECKGQAYISLHNDLHPQMFIENRSKIKLFFAQSSSNDSNTIVNDCQHFNWMCSVEDGRTSYYSMLGYSEKFPDLSQNFIENLVISTDPQDDPRGFQWSTPLNILRYSDQFLRIPHYGDAKVTVVNSIHTSFITIDSASQVEISAKDIRVRLFMHENEVFDNVEKPSVDVNNDVLNLYSNTDGNTSTMSVYHSTEDTTAINSNIISNIQSTSTFTSYGFKTLPTLIEHSTGNVLSSFRKSSSEMKPWKSSNLNFSNSVLTYTLPMKKDWTTVKITTFIKGINFTFLSDLNSTNGKYMEIASLSCDDIVVIATQTENMNVSLSILEIQFDNKLYPGGGFDFPVVFVGQERKSSEVLKSLNCSVSQLITSAQKDPLVQLNFTLETWKDTLQNKNITKIKDIKVKVQPISAYIEDAYIIKLMDYLGVLFSNKLVLWPMYSKNMKFTLNSSLVAIPDHILWESAMLAQPLTLHNLSIEPLSLLLSVHCSVKLYIALDQSPLQFGKFERKRLLTSPYRLGHALTMHYLSGAIFGAGWVVGSLELLGSPSGLARAMGSGLKDFVRLPYRGFIQGPWAFLRGITHGSASLMRHVTAGTLQSVTKLASSVARNLDRLTLDEEHLKRTEEQRRQRPQGLTQGFIQGLTGLGISLLGAVGGIAHHPIQSVMSDGASPRGLAAGVGLGLVGVITKPLSGAADLVALTGQGFLQGAGWNPLPEPRSEAALYYVYSNPNSFLKYKWKFMQSITQSNLLFVTDATWITAEGQYEGVALVLTTNAFIIINTDEDLLQKVIGLSEISSIDNSADPTLLSFKLTSATIVFKNQDDVTLEMDPACRARVVDYVQSTVKLQQFSKDISPDSSEISVSPIPTPNSTSETVKHTELIFHVNPQNKNYFITLLRLLKEQYQNYSFPIL